MTHPSRNRRYIPVSSQPYQQRLGLTTSRPSFSLYQSFGGWQQPSTMASSLQLEDTLQPQISQEVLNSSKSLT